MSTFGHKLGPLRFALDVCRRHPLVAILCVSGVGVVVVMGLMFLAWEREHEALECVYAIGGKVGSLGARPFPQEYYIWFPEPADVQDEDLRHLSGLRHVRMSSHVTLNLRGPRITDDGIAYLATLETVDVFSIERTGVTDSGARKLHEAQPNAVIILSNE